MKSIIDKMHADVAIAAWNAAASILTMHGGNAEAAKDAAVAAVGRGLGVMDGEHIVYLIDRLNEERNGK